MRRTVVAWEEGGQSYPAFLRSGSKADGSGHVRPYFTRRTVGRILRDTHSAEERNPELLPDERTRVRWEGYILVILSSPYHPGRDFPWRFRPNGQGMYALFDKRDWVEVQPSWPKRKPGPRALVRLLESPSPNYLPTLFRIQNEVATATLIETINVGDERIKEILVRPLAMRPEPEAGEAIAGLLFDQSPRVRGEAAHAIEHAGSTQFPEKLLEAARSERDAGALELELRALASINMKDALPWVRRLADDPNADAHIKELATDTAYALRSDKS